MIKKHYFGLGRRKCAVAQVRLTVSGHSKVVNGVNFDQYFTTHDTRQAALAPLLVTSQADQLGFACQVSGGGKRAQADAVKLGLARAIVDFNQDFRKQLKAAGLLTRDARVKERKKYGLKGARRAPQFSKR